MALGTGAKKYSLLSLPCWRECWEEGWFWVLNKTIPFVSYVDYRWMGNRKKIDKLNGDNDSRVSIQGQVSSWHGQEKIPQRCQNHKALCYDFAKQQRHSNHSSQDSNAAAGDKSAARDVNKKRDTARDDGKNVLMSKALREGGRQKHIKINANAPLALPAALMTTTMILRPTGLPWGEKTKKNKWKRSRNDSPTQWSQEDRLTPVETLLEK